MPDTDDYAIWRAWWWATSYGADPEHRRRAVDKLRGIAAARRRRVTNRDD